MIQMAQMFDITNYTYIPRYIPVRGRIKEAAKADMIVKTPMCWGFNYIPYPSVIMVT